DGAAVRAVLSRRRGPSADIRHGNGTVHHPRSPDGTERSRLGRERAATRRPLLHFGAGASTPARAHGRPFMSQRILIVDDEPSILAAMAPLLRARGYQVITATTGHAAIDAVDRHAPQLVVLDLGLPDLAGVDVCRQIREGRTTPILILSARGAEADKVAALDAGADDYVTKPFSTEELLARVRAALRRSEPGAVTTGQISRGNLTIDIDRHRVIRGDEEVRLTPKEFELLLFLMQHP